MICLTCPSGFFYNTTQQTCVSSQINTCPIGATFDQQSQLCVCPINTPFNNGQQCLPCPLDLHWNVSTKVC
jgi:hypothetical protein